MERLTFRSRADALRARLNSDVRPLNEMSQSAGIASSPTGPWVWLFPLAYGLHIAEEYAFHFPAYVANVSGRHISNSQFLFLNAVFWLLMVAAIVVLLARPSQSLARHYARSHSRYQRSGPPSRQRRHRYLLTGHRHGRAPLRSSRRIRTSAGPSAREPWPCHAGRGPRRGHSRRRLSPGGQPIAHPIAVSALTLRSKPTPDSDPSFNVIAYNNLVLSQTHRHGRVSPKRLTARLLYCFANRR